MDYISTPLTFFELETGVGVVRDIKNQAAMLDNLIELIVYTPKGSFLADPDFGFEYWNHEYSNIHFLELNDSYGAHPQEQVNSEVTKQKCEDSIRDSLATYCPELKQPRISISLHSADLVSQHKRKVLSKYMVKVAVEGMIDGGLGMNSPYSKEVVFFMEPTAKRSWRR